MAETEVKQFDVSTLSDDERANFLYFNQRRLDLQKVRTNHYAKNLDQLWADADRDYVPHRLQTSGKKVVAVDEDKGWRGALVTLGSNDWQSDLSKANVYIKIQTALSILVDQNPSGVFTPTTEKYQATTELIKQLYERSWEFAKSRAQLKLFIFNLAKYGWAAARTYPKRITRKVKVITEYNEENPEKSKYETKEVEVYNDVYRENLDVRNVWIDDMSRPNNPNSVNDWVWRKVYTLEDFKEEFKAYSRTKNVQAGGVIDEVINTQNLNKTKNLQRPGELVEVYFYENLRKDLFAVVANGVPIILDPLPISDSQGNKKLSLWQAYWTLRHSESPYGIGIYEALRYDQAMLDRFRNMTIDQITLSIYKMWFYQGTGSLNETGDIHIQPGVGKQVLDPKNVQFLQVPGPGADAYQGLETFQKDVDGVSGITDPLQGEITGKTAFELAQAKESALKRMKEPLDNILEALNQEGYITVSLIQLIYSIPETYELTDQKLIEDYLHEIASDPDLYEDNGQTDTGDRKITAKVYPEFPLNLEKDEKGNLTQTNDTKFFRVKPKYLHWEGIINIKSQSLLTPSKQIDKALYIEMQNTLMPMIGSPLPDAPLRFGKMAKELVKQYDKDPRDILPDSWLNPEQSIAEQMQNQPLIVPQEQAGQPQQPGQPQGQPSLPTQPLQQPQVPAQAISQQPQSLVGKISSGLGGIFRKMQ